MLINVKKILINAMTEKNDFDLVIIGAGPAGLTAGMYGVRAELNLVVLEKLLPGGLIATAGTVENYPGFPKGIKGIEIAEKIREQAENAGVKIKTFQEVKSLEKSKSGFKIKTEKEEYTAKAVIIATGLEHRKLGVKGEEEFAGQGVSYCATCDGALFRNKKVAVVGGGTGAAMAALNLSDIAAEVKIIAAKAQLSVAEKIIEKRVLSKSNIEIIGNARVNEIFGNKVVKGIRIEKNVNNKKIEEEIGADGVFVEVGKAPNTSFLKNAASSIGLEMENDYIIVDAYQRTSVPGLFAAGDVTNSKIKQLSLATAQGAVAALSAYEYLKIGK